MLPKVGFWLFADHNNITRPDCEHYKKYILPTSTVSHSKALDQGCKIGWLGLESVERAIAQPWGKITRFVCRFFFFFFFFGWMVHEAFCGFIAVWQWYLARSV